MLHFINDIFKSRKKITDSKIFLYNILLVIIFAAIYYIVDHSVDYKTHNKKLSLIDSLYFSIVTQTTLGFGDIVPTHSLTRIIVIIQCLCIMGLLYLL
jgi:voltage-gated potassium channel Kch